MRPSPRAQQNGGRALAWILIVILAAITADLWVPHFFGDPRTIDSVTAAANRHPGPDRDSLMGTDELGRDIFGRVRLRCSDFARCRLHGRGDQHDDRLATGGGCRVLWQVARCLIMRITVHLPCVSVHTVRHPDSGHRGRPRRAVSVRSFWRSACLDGRRLPACIVGRCSL